MKTQLSILAICLAAGCAHGKSTDTAERAEAHTPPRAERQAKTAHVKGEAPVAQQAPESPSDVPPERVDVPAVHKRDEMASAGRELPAPREPRTGAPASDYGTQPDNTRVNERDRDNAALTPMDQGEGASDRELTQKIRKAVIADDSLSFTAKNVKIITRDGRVTLRGSVNSAAERTTIEQAARAAAGPNKVENQLEVAKD